MAADGPPPDSTAPVLTTRLPSHIKRSRRGALVAKVRVRCSEACDVRVRVVLDSFELASVVRELAAGKTATFTTASDAEQRGGVRGRNPRRARLEVIASDRAGNADRASRTVRIQRR